MIEGSLKDRRVIGWNQSNSLLSYAIWSYENDICDDAEASFYVLHISILMKAYKCYDTCIIKQCKSNEKQFYFTLVF